MKSEIIKYFKTPLWGDCYIANDNYMNIVSISKKDLCVFADDERIFAGPYKEIKINKNDFEKMEEFAKRGKRKELTEILKKIHEDNKVTLNLSKDPFIYVFPKDKMVHIEKSSSFRTYFFSTKPILK